MPKQNSKGATHKLTDMPPSRLYLQQQKGYLSQKIQKQKLSIDYLVKECVALFATRLTQLTLVFAKFRNSIILNYQLSQKLKLLGYSKFNHLTF